MGPLSQDSLVASVCQLVACTLTSLGIDPIVFWGSVNPESYGKDPSGPCFVASVCRLAVCAGASLGVDPLVLCESINPMS